MTRSRIPAFFQTTFDTMPWEKTTLASGVELYDTGEGSEQVKQIVFYVPGLWTHPLSSVSTVAMIAHQTRSRVVLLSYRATINESNLQSRVDDVALAYQTYVEPLSKDLDKPIVLVPFCHGTTTTCKWLAESRDRKSRIKKIVFLHAVQSALHAARQCVKPTWLLPTSKEREEDTVFPYLNYVIRRYPCVMIQCEDDVFLDIQDWKAWAHLNPQYINIVWLPNSQRRNRYMIHFTVRFDESKRWLKLIS